MKPIKPTKSKQKKLTEIVFILDRSGSMSGLEQDTIGGFNAMIQKQKDSHIRGLVSTVLFNSEAVVLHDRIKLSDVPKMTTNDYQVGGMTALLDAVGSAIKHIGNIHKYARKEDLPTNTIFVITTDGRENASKIYNLAKVKSMIEEQKSKYDWEFIFLGANIDAIAAARDIGIDADHSVRYKEDCQGTRVLYQTVSDVLYKRACCEEKLPKNWKKDIENDFIKRGTK